MKKSSQNTRLPASFRTTTPPAAMAKTGLALGISTAMLMPLAALCAEPDTTLKAVKVQSTVIDPNPNAEQGVPYKAKTSGDERHTRPLAETPQTITVITKSAIDDAGSSDLRQILDGQPGITLGTGENGNAFGDRYIIRGQEARSDVFVDGLRDPGMTIRESFAIEQLEISKGPSSSFAGRGTVGGAINAITKQATRDYNFAKISTGFGTDDYTRLTLDANQPLGDQFAVRANALWAYEEVPDRAPADRERKGLALSGLWSPREDLDVVLDYYRFRGKDNPDIGSYIVAATRKVAKNVPVYLQDSDFLESDVDTYTARVKYEFNDHLRLSNLTRYGTTDNAYVTTGARGTNTSAGNPGGQYFATTLDSGHSGWQAVEYFANQTNLFLNQNIFGMKHEFIVGLEYSSNSVTGGSYNLNNSGFNCMTGTSTTLNAWCATTANGHAVNGIHTLIGRNIVKNDWNKDWSIKTTSVYLMDTFDITDDVTLFAGIRYDAFDFQLRAPWNHDGDTGTGATPNVLGNFKDSDGIWNGHLGATYKINPEVMVYASYSTASDINGGESDVGTATGYGGLAVNIECTDRTNANPALRGCNPNGSIESDPENTENIEAGTKWNILNDSLLLTAAVFQITKDNVMEGSGYESGASFNTGKNRVRGIEFGATGEITDKLMLQAGYTLMDSEVLKSVTPSNEGKLLSNFAQNSGIVQLKYQFTDAFALGTAARYEGKRYGGQPDTAAVFNTTTGSYNVPLPSYVVYDLFASYRFTKEFDARLNFNNVTDKDYYTAAYRGGTFVYLGDAQSLRLTLNYEFH